MNPCLKINQDLIKKYDGATPRYTSYPAAPHFTEKFGSEDYRQVVQRSNQGLVPLDLSLYVHIPFCHSLCYFCGCNKIVTQSSNSKVELYLDALRDEIAMQARLFDADRRVSQIHFGGGTPNFLDLEQLSEVLENIASSFHLDLPSKLEISIEVDPRVVEASDIDKMARIGFNRFSIGVQDFSEPVQQAINRIQPEDQTLEIIAAAKACGHSVNADLISGLPAQTPDSFDATLRTLLDSDVERIAIYNFAYLPNRIKAQKLLDASLLPDRDTRMAINQRSHNTLLEAGYVHIGMDHFAKPDDSLSKALKNNTLHRNFQGYSTHRDTDLIGLGASSISKIDGCYAQNHGTISDYVERVRSQSLPVARGLELNDEDHLRAHVIQQIMCRREVDLQQRVDSVIEVDSEQTLAEHFAKQVASLEAFVEDGLIARTDTGFEISDQGRLFMRQIAAHFDEYIETPAQGGRIVEFSRSL